MKEQFYLTKQSGTPSAGKISLDMIFEFHSFSTIIDSCCNIVALSRETQYDISAHLYILSHLRTLIETFILCGWIKVGSMKGSEYHCTSQPY